MTDCQRCEHPVHDKPCTVQPVVPGCGCTWWSAIPRDDLRGSATDDAARVARIRGAIAMEELQRYNRARIAARAADSAVNAGGETPCYCANEPCDRCGQAVAPHSSRLHPDTPASARIDDSAAELSVGDLPASHLPVAAQDEGCTHYRLVCKSCGQPFGSAMENDAVAPVSTRAELVEDLEYAIDAARNDGALSDAAAAKLTNDMRAALAGCGHDRHEGEGLLRRGFLADRGWFYCEATADTPARPVAEGKLLATRPAGDQRAVHPDTEALTAACVRCGHFPTHHVMDPVKSWRSECTGTVETDEGITLDCRCVCYADAAPARTGGQR